MDKEIVEYMYSGMLFSLKEESVPFVTMWMNLEYIMLHEIRHRKTNIA